MIIGLVFVVHMDFDERRVVVVAGVIVIAFDVCMGGAFEVIVESASVEEAAPS